MVVLIIKTRAFTLIPTTNTSGLKWILFVVGDRHMTLTSDCDGDEREKINKNKTNSKIKVTKLKKCKEPFRG